MNIIIYTIIKKKKKPEKIVEQYLFFILEISNTVIFFFYIHIKYRSRYFIFCERKINVSQLVYSNIIIVMGKRKKTV